jgi:hypothetical protein
MPDPALKSRARLKCRSATGESRPFESHHAPCVGFPNPWLHLFFKDHQSRVELRISDLSRRSDG